MTFRFINVPCVVAARALCSLSFAPALVQLGNRQELVWASPEDLFLEPQPPGDELKGSLQCKIVRQEGNSVTVSVRSRGVERELHFEKTLIGQILAKVSIPQSA